MLQISDRQMLGGGLFVQIIACLLISMVFYEDWQKVMASALGGFSVIVTTSIFAWLFFGKGQGGVREIANNFVISLIAKFILLLFFCGLFIYLHSGGSIKATQVFFGALATYVAHWGWLFFLLIYYRQAKKIRI